MLLPFTAVCRRLLRVNTMENDPLPSFASENRLKLQYQVFNSMEILVATVPFRLSMFGLPVLGFLCKKRVSLR